MEATQAYMKQHDYLMPAIEAALNEAVTQKEAEPLPFIASSLQKQVEARKGSQKGFAPFFFTSGLPDAVTSNPEYYKVVAEIPNARLVEMVVPPGGADKPHEHPAHSLYFVTAAKLAIAEPPGAEPKTMEIPAGAAPIFPAGPHQVSNVGENETRVLFVEPMPTCIPCGEVPEFVSPFTVSPKCYSCLASNDDWITGIMTMEPGEEDTLHNHKDHLIYVIEGDELTIYPGGDKEKGAVVPIKPFAGIPAPISAGAIFQNHVVKNSGKGTVKMLFFEMKK